MSYLDKLLKNGELVRRLEYASAGGAFRSMTIEEYEPLHKIVAQTRTFKEVPEWIQKIILEAEADLRIDSSMWDHT